MLPLFCIWFHRSLTNLCCSAGFVSTFSLLISVHASAFFTASIAEKTDINQKRREMYEEVPGTGFSAGTASLLSEDHGFSQMVTSAATQTHYTAFSENVGLSMESLAFGSEDAIANTAFTNGASATSALIMEQNPFGNTHLLEQVNHNHLDSNQLALSFDHSTWDTSNIQNHHRQHHHQPLLYPTPPDHHHLHLLYSLPTTASTFSFVNSSISHENPTGHGGLVGGSYPNMGPESTDVSSVLHLNPPAHAPALRDLFQSLPSSDFLLFGGEDDRDFDDNGELKFTRDMPAVGRRGGGRGKGIKQVTNEKQRRVKFSSKFDALRELIPNPTKVKYMKFHSFTYIYLVDSSMANYYWCTCYSPFYSFLN